MTLREIDRQLEKLYSTYENYNGITISTGITYEGNPINFLFQKENDKYVRIYTNKNFSEWIAWCTNGWTKAAPKIEKLAEIYGVQWDNDAGSLYIRFRRNELTLAQAVMRLQQAVSVVGCLGED
ncbi:MAG: hypothetical protein E7384_07180 [Ruminococcaceae bacterium]|nr:hypothetical protein [Oscillospiraceae bacterium]